MYQETDETFNEFLMYPGNKNSLDIFDYVLESIFLNN